MKISWVVSKLFERGKTVTQKYNLVLAHIQLKFKNIYIYSYPTRLTIDPCNHCNLQCVLCPTGTKTKGRKQSIMKFNTFKIIMDECGPYIYEIDLFNWGEPLLNKDIFRMIEYARKMKIDVSISTNLNYFNNDICISLIESGLNKLILSLDGASQESVITYQKGSNFQLVIDNLKQIVHMKEKLNSKLPFIQWRFLVNRYNEHEIEKAIELSNVLKIDKLELGAFRCDMGNELLLNNEAQFNNVEPWLPNNETLSMYGISQKQKKDIKNICRYLWLESTIQPDGSVSPCCAVWHDKFDFGNINDVPFKKIWNNDKYKHARLLGRGNDISVSKHICSICYLNKAQI